MKTSGKQKLNNIVNKFVIPSAFGKRPVGVAVGSLVRSCLDNTVLSISSDGVV